MKKLLLLLTLFVSFIVISNSAIKVPMSNSFTDFVNKFSPLYISLFSSNEATPKTFRVLKFGYNLDVDAGANEDIWAVGGMQTFAPTAETVNVVSSNAADDDGSTGALSVFITGITTDGTQVTEVVTMNGTSNVLTTTPFSFINRAVVLTAGSALKNAGAISFTQSSSAIVIAQIPAGTSTTKILNYRVPSDRRCYINNLYLTTTKQASADPRVIFYVKVLSATQNVEYEIRRVLIDTEVNDFREFPNFKSQALLPNEIISFEVDSNSANTEVTGTLDMTCIVI